MYIFIYNINIHITETAPVMMEFHKKNAQCLTGLAPFPCITCSKDGRTSGPLLVLVFIREIRI